MRSSSKLAYIGLDLGNDCGFAVLRASGTRIESGTWQLKAGKDEMPAARWIHFAAHLRELVTRYKKAGYTVIVTYEYVPVQWQRGPDAAYVYGGWLAILEIAAAEHKDVVWQPIDVHDWKYAVTGSKHAKIPVYVAAINKRFSLSLKPTKLASGGGEDEAAALGVAYASVVLRGQLATS